MSNWPAQDSLFDVLGSLNRSWRSSHLSLGYATTLLDITNVRTFLEVGLQFKKRVCRPFFE